MLAGTNILEWMDLVIGMDSFGESAPAKELFSYFGFTTDKVVEAVNKLTAVEVQVE